MYAANTAAGRIDVFDSNFQRLSGPGVFAFEDPDLPAGLSSFHPFNVQNLNGTLYVTYQNFNPANPRIAKPGGIVDAFDTNGNFLRRVVTGGLNAPWGLAIAPATFGKFADALLVGNFGEDDGKINAFNLKTGAFVGYLTDATGNPLVFDDLWTLTFGNGGMGGDRNILYFSAGINDEKDGLFGSIRLVSGAGAPPLPAKIVGSPAATTMDVGAAAQLLSGGLKSTVGGASSPNHTTDLSPLTDAILDSASVQLPLDGQSLAGIFGSSKIEGSKPGTSASHDVSLPVDDLFATVLQSNSGH